MSEVNPSPKPKKEDAPPPEPGKYGQLLAAQGIHTEPEGLDILGVERLVVPGDKLVAACRILRDNPDTRFDLLVSVSGVDMMDHRLSVYHLYSSVTHDRLVVKCVAVDEHVPSVVSIWQTADWHEREAYDLMGILYDGHPNLTRILMPIDWLGHPLRKDYVNDDPRLVWNER